MNEFLKPFAGADDGMPLYVELAGITYPDTTYRISRNSSEVLVIEYVLDGRGYVVLDGKTYPVTKDTIYCLHPGACHHYYADSNDPFSKIFLNVSGDFCEQLLLAYHLSDFHFFENTDLKPVFQRILTVIHGNKTDSEMQFALQGIALEIFSRLSFSRYTTQHSAEALRLKNYLDSHVETLVHGEELAACIFRSQDYCQKLFIREFRTTPYAYQLNRKMQIARQLLVGTSLSVGEIAEKLGYSDSHYFSNLFLKKCGCRPSAYRKGGQ